MEHLVFQLHGTMSSWGRPAGDEHRPAYRFPTKSALLGLIAGALGYKRKEMKKQTALFESLFLALVVEQVGEEMHDYHTATPPESNFKFLYSRKDELNWSTGDPVVNRRVYRNNGIYTVCFWESENSSVDLQEIADKLKKPEFTPYIGRKSCPPSLPFAPQVMDSETLFEAFESYWETRPSKTTQFFKILGDLPGKEVLLLWEKHQNPGVAEDKMKSISRQNRRDQPASRKSWTFKNRLENQALIKREEV